MTSANTPLIHARNSFAARCPESRVILTARDWGVIDRGTGPVLLMLPGTLGRADIFWQQIDALSELRVVAVSYPASGSLLDWAQDLETLLTQRGIDQVAVLGSSLGGYLAQFFAAANPARVTHLFAANTLSSVALVATRPPYALDLWAAPIDDLRGGFAAAMQAQPPTRPEEAHLIDLLLAEVAGRILEPELRARLDALKTAPSLPAYHGGSEDGTVIESADDPLIPPPLQEGVRARMGSAPVFRFDWGGHFPYVLRPDLYTALIRARLGLAPLPPAWATGIA